MAPFYSPAILPNFGTMTTVTTSGQLQTVAVPFPVTTVGPTGLPLLTVDLEDLKNRIRAQIEYYFSTENLTRDVFIRRKMDIEGYLPISLIASFHRVQHLTQDVNMIINSLKDSASVELSGNGLKARPREDPFKWPLNPDGSTTSSIRDESKESDDTSDL